jgi:hypothetical protein
MISFEDASAHSLKKGPWHPISSLEIHIEPRSAYQIQSNEVVLVKVYLSLTKSSVAIWCFPGRELPRVGASRIAFTSVSADVAAQVTIFLHRRLRSSSPEEEESLPQE